MVAALESATMIDWVKSVAIKLTVCVLLHLRASQAKPPFPEATILSLPPWAPHLIHIIPVTSAYQDFQPHRPLISLHVSRADVTPPLFHVLPGFLLFIINPASLLRSPRRFFVFVQVSTTLLQFFLTLSQSFYFILLSFRFSLCFSLICCATHFSKQCSLAFLRKDLAFANLIAQSSSHNYFPGSNHSIKRPIVKQLLVFF